MNRSESLRNSNGAAGNSKHPHGSGTPDASFDQFADVDPSRFEAFHPQDQAALEALVSAHFRVDDVSADLRPTAQGMASLLSLLDRGPRIGDADRTLVDLSLARIAQQRRRTAGVSSELSLSGDDDEALEALIAAEFNVERVPSVIRNRAKRVGNLLALLDGGVSTSGAAASVTSSANESSPLVERTLARVQRAIEEHEDRLSLAGAAPEAFEGDRRGGFSLRLPDLISAAALLFIGVMLLAPMAMGVRAYNQQQSCAVNMHTAGVAFGAYAGDFQSHFPVASRARGGERWNNIGKVEQSNSANLFVLNRASYTSLESLACCGNESASSECAKDAVDWCNLNEISYSYQCQFADRRPNWSSGGRVVILADASPVVRRAMRGEAILPFENSPNHDGRGQNVLFNDGSGAWLKTPNVPYGRNDNIWLPRNIEAEIARMKRNGATDPIEGTEEPEREDDSFVVP